jgi:O-antigen/teichoic acid export membrane protein
MDSLARGSALAIRGGAIRVVGYAAGVVISLGTATILIRHLGVSGFGRYVTVTSLVALIGGVTEAGIHVYGIREFARRPEPERGQVMGRLLAMRLTMSAAGVACVALFGLGVGYTQVIVLGTLVAGAGLMVQVIADVLSISLQSELRLGRLTVVDLSRRVAALVLVAVLAALVGASVLPFLAASTAAATVALALLAWMVRSSATIRLSFDPRGWRELFGDTLLYAVAMSIGAVYFYITVVVMSLIASANQVGLFATSFRVTQVALGIPVLLLTAIFPLMSRQDATDGERARSAAGKVFTVAVIGGVWLSLAMAIGANFVIDVVAGSRAHGAVSVLRIQALVLTASFVSTSSALGLISLRRYRPMVIASSSALALNIVLGLILIPALGAKGGALADVVVETLVAIVLTLTLMRAGPRHAITASLLPPVLLAAALSVTVLLIPIGSLAQAIGATGIYFAVLLITGAIPGDVIAAARRARVLDTLS